MPVQAQLAWKLSGSLVQPIERMWNVSDWADQGGGSAVNAQIKDADSSVAEAPLKQGLRHTPIAEWRNSNVQ